MMRRSKNRPRAASPPVEASRSIAPPWHSVPTAIARRFHQICAAKTSEVVGKVDLTPLQYGALVNLSMLTGKPGIEQNGFADRLNVDRNTASLLVEQLVKKGLVERQVNEADRRARLLRLTPNGEKLYARLRPAHIVADQSILAPINPAERKLLIDLLIRVIEGNLVDEKRGTSTRKGKSSS